MKLFTSQLLNDMRFKLVAGLIISFLLIIFSFEMIPQERNLVEHPILWFDENKLSKLRLDIEQYQWMKDIFVVIREEADAIMREEIAIPVDGGIINEKIFPGGKKIIEKNIGEYYSESENKTYQGETVIKGKGQVVLNNFPYKQYFDNRKHHSLAHKAKVLAFAYAVTNQEQYAKKAREIIFGYAKNFSENKYPLHNQDGGNYAPEKISSTAGRLTVSALEDSLWAYHMMCAYDWTFNSGLYSQSEIDLISNMFFVQYKTAKRELDSANYKDNHTASENLSRLAYGIISGNRDIVKESIEGKMGFKDHLDTAMNSEGRVEPEGVGYHFAFMLPMYYIAEIYDRIGDGNLFMYEENKLKRGADFIINSTFIDGLKIPQIQNSHPDWSWTPAFQSLFEIAYNRYKDDSYLIPALNNLSFLSDSQQINNYQNQIGKWGKVSRGTYTQMGGPHYIEAIMAGAPEIDNRNPGIILPSVHFKESKYVFLRKGDSLNGVGVFLTYDNHGHHSDVGSLQIFTQGREQGVEAGMPISYDSPDYAEWYSQRIAHNCVIVDQKSPGIPSDYQHLGPQLSSFGTAEIIGFSDASTTLMANGTIYEGVAMERKISLEDDMSIVIQDRILSDKFHIYDWVYRNRGKIESIKGVDLLPWQGELGDDFGYKKEYLFNIRRGVADKKITVTWRNPGFQNDVSFFELSINPDKATDVIIADSYYGIKKEIIPIIILRRADQETLFNVKARYWREKKNGG